MATTTVDQGNTHTYKGVRFQSMGKGKSHCKGTDGEWCGRMCFSYMAHAEWHASGGQHGEEGY